MYKMEEIMVVGGKPQFENKLLQKATDEIFKVADTIRKCAFRTAVVMAKVDETECFKEDGFNSVHEWAQETFGFKKSASYSLLRIGKEYVREIKNPNTGKITGYATNLTKEDAEADFSMTQVEKMLPLGHPVALELVEAGEIKPSMSCKEIGQFVKNYLAEDEEEPAEGAEEPAEGAEEPAEGAEEKTVFVTVAVINADGSIADARYMVPSDVLEQYKVEIK